MTISLVSFHLFYCSYKSMIALFCREWIYCDIFAFIFSNHSFISYKNSTNIALFKSLDIFPRISEIRIKIAWIERYCIVYFLNKLNISAWIFIKDFQNWYIVVFCKWLLILFCSYGTVYRALKNAEIWVNITTFTNSLVHIVGKIFFLKNLERYLYIYSKLWKWYSYQ